MTGLHSGSHNCRPCVPRVVVSPRKATAKSPRRHSPPSALFSQPASPLAIVQTYSAVQAAPTDSIFEPHQSPESSTPTKEACEPGISTMLPETATTNPAPAESDVLVTLSVY